MKGEEKVLKKSKELQKNESKKRKKTEIKSELKEKKMKKKSLKDGIDEVKQNEKKRKKKALGGENNAHKPEDEKQYFQKKQVKLAVRALSAYLKDQASKQKHVDLYDTDETLWLMVNFKKTPPSLARPIRIPLPHTSLGDDREVCLITSKPGKDIKKIFEEKGVDNVHKVISLTKLRKEYGTFQLKRQLLSTYDVFLCEDKIYPLVVKALGKEAFKRKKLPIQVRLRYDDWKKEFSRCINSALLRIGHGSCSSLRCGSFTKNNEQELFENVLHAMNVTARKIPGKKKNIKSFLIKSSNSIALPVYQANPLKTNDLPDVPDDPRIEPPKKKKKMDELLWNNMGIDDEFGENGDDDIDFKQHVTEEAKKNDRKTEAGNKEVTLEETSVCYNNEADCDKEPVTTIYENEESPTKVNIESEVPEVPKAQSPKKKKKKGKTNACNDDQTANSKKELSQSEVPNAQSPRKKRGKTTTVCSNKDTDCKQEESNSINSEKEASPVEVDRPSELPKFQSLKKKTKKGKTTTVCSNKDADSKQESNAINSEKEVSLVEVVPPSEVPNVQSPKKKTKKGKTNVGSNKDADSKQEESNAISSENVEQSNVGENKDPGYITIIEDEESEGRNCITITEDGASKVDKNCANTENQEKDVVEILADQDNNENVTKTASEDRKKLENILENVVEEETIAEKKSRRRSRKPIETPKVTPERKKGLRSYSAKKAAKATK